MKKFFASILSISLLSLCLAACSDDDKNDNNNNNGNTVDAESICDFVIQHNGDSKQYIETPSFSSDELKAEAKKLCVEEINGLPKCKTEMTDFLTCEMQNGYGTEKCVTAGKALSSCSNKLLDADDESLNEYLNSYSSKYNALK